MLVVLMKYMKLTHLTHYLLPCPSNKSRDHVGSCLYLCDHLVARIDGRLTTASQPALLQSSKLCIL